MFYAEADNRNRDYPNHQNCGTDALDVDLRSFPKRKKDIRRSTFSAEK
jgi:hypothetical protein